MTNVNLMRKFVMTFAWKRVKADGISMSEAMKDSWRIAKANVENYGIKTLELVLKTAITKSSASTPLKDGIKTWFYNKEFSSSEKMALHGALTETVKRETEKALLISWKTDMGFISKWVPKSCVAA